MDRDTLITQIYECAGNLNEVSRRMGVRRESIANKVQIDQELKDIVAKAREVIIDEAEYVIKAAVNGDDPAAARDASKFVLSRLGRRRGWATEEQQIFAGMGSNVTINRITPEAKPNASDR